MPGHLAPGLLLLLTQCFEVLFLLSPRRAHALVHRVGQLVHGNHEIARMLGASRSTVNVILHRTRQKLREEIASYVGEES